MAASNEIPRTVQWNEKNVPIYPMETISFERLLSQEPAELEKLLRCCETEGFFYLDLQGIDGRRYLKDQENTLDLMHRFFESPLELKNQFGLVSPHLGYVLGHQICTLLSVRA
jgi:isopenicillin N synthase-like dioxygenase